MREKNPSLPNPLDSNKDKIIGQPEAINLKWNSHDFKILADNLV